MIKDSGKEGGIRKVGQTSGKRRIEGDPSIIFFFTFFPLLIFFAWSIPGSWNGDFLKEIDSDRPRSTST